MLLEIDVIKQKASGTLGKMGSCGLGNKTPRWPGASHRTDPLKQALAE